MWTLFQVRTPLLEILGSSAYLLFTAEKAAK